MKLRTLFCSTLVCSLALVADRAGGGAGPADSASDIPYLRKQGTANGLEARLLYAFGRHDAIGVSPMEIERPAAPDIEPTTVYDGIKQLAPLISKPQGNGTMSAVLLGANDAPQKVQVGDYSLECSCLRPRVLPRSPQPQPPLPMQNDDPLLLKLAVDITPFGTMIHLPAYWSFDPKRDIRWDAIASLHRARVPGRQGSGLGDIQFL
jgi:hypothetical protein